MCNDDFHGDEDFEECTCSYAVMPEATECVCEERDEAMRIKFEELDHY